MIDWMIEWLNGCYSCSLSIWYFDISCYLATFALLNIPEDEDGDWCVVNEKDRVCKEGGRWKVG